MFVQSLQSMAQAVARFDVLHARFAEEIRRRDDGGGVEDVVLYRLLASRARACVETGCQVPHELRRRLPGRVSQLLHTVERKGRRGLDILDAASDPHYLADAAAMVRGGERLAIQDLGEAVRILLAEQEAQSELTRLLGEAAAGERKAFARFYDETIGVVYAIARRLCRNEPEIEEVVNDVYLQVWRSAASYDAARGSVTAWLRTIVRSRAIDARRRAQILDRGRCDLDALPEETIAGPAAYIPLERFEDASEVRRALATLPPRQQEILGLAFFRDMGHAEIAATLGIPLGTVKSHIHSSIKKLRRALRESEAA